MTALLNISHIFIRGTMWPDFSQVVLLQVSMDTGIYLAGSKNILAIGVESCTCPPDYKGNSCQDPALGYYRHRNTSLTNSLEMYFGSAKKCNCNERSEECNMETGHCRVSF